MASRVRVRRSPVRRAAAPAAPQIPQYQRSRAAIVLAMFALVFGFLWIVNGSFTAAMVEQLGGDPAWGWALHLIMSAVEVAPAMIAPFLKGVPRWAVITFWLLSLPFGMFDVYSSAAGMASWMEWTRLSGLPAAAQNTLLGEALAFLPEPMLFWLITLLHRVIRA